MLCPFAAQKPVPNHGGPIGQILGVVIHVTAGEGDPYNEFANPANQVSSHFGIGNGQGGMIDGALEQYVDTSLTSWAQVAGNANYISVETEGEPTEPLTPAQLACFGRLYAWLHATHGVPLVVIDTPGESGFITHGDGGEAWGGHLDCPGPLRTPQRQQILDRAGGAVGPLPGGVKMSDFPNAVGACLTADGNGTWVVGSDGGVFCVGDAVEYGSLPGIGIKVSNIVGIARSWGGKGYYLCGADGGVFAFGDATEFGSYPGLPAAERQGDRSFGAGSFNLHWGGTGYRLVGLDGSRYAFGS